MRMLVRVFALLILGCLCLFVLSWNTWVDHAGISVAGAVTDKRETIRASYADWFRRFQVIATFKVPGSALDHSNVCDVDQQTFDAIRIGQPVTIHVMPGLIFQPFLPSSHSSICPQSIVLGSNAELYRRFGYLYGSLAAILVAGVFLRIKTAWWLLVPWSAFFVFYGVCPHAEPAPLHPVPATAVVKQVNTIESVMQNHRRSNATIPLTHPYQLVQLAFTPAGRTDPVVAIDAIDRNSAPNAQQGRNVPIEYDAVNPRVARIQGATRNFPQQAQQQIGLEYLVIAGLLVALLLFAGRRSRSSGK